MSSYFLLLFQKRDSSTILSWYLALFPSTEPLGGGLNSAWARRDESQVFTQLHSYDTPRGGGRTLGFLGPLPGLRWEGGPPKGFPYVPPPRFSPLKRFPPRFFSGVGHMVKSVWALDQGTEEPIFGHFWGGSAACPGTPRPSSPRG